MRIGIVEKDGRRRLAVAAPGGYVDVASTASNDKTEAGTVIARAQGVEEVLRLGDAGLRTVERLARGAPVATDAPRWRSPLVAPSKICGIGLNYADHCREQGLEPPTSPILFAKYANAIVGPGDEITWNPSLTSMVDWEAELAVVIGRRARNVARDEAFAHVAGYVAANDVTARNLQKSDGQFVRAKTLDTFCPLGPYLVTRDEVADPHRLRIRSRVNGVTKQDSSTSNLIFG
ncbi:MAG: fumarylacetoacetate hydrolase family protein, partial [Euryarchaeota archaeon]|nr:fumarylacetoacetate hydrolase family protein [Euryarchaeota archaeon]